MPDRDHAADAQRILDAISANEYGVSVAAGNVARAYLDQSAALEAVKRVALDCARVIDEIGEALTEAGVHEVGRKHIDALRILITERDEERRLHATTAVSLQQAEKRIEELSAQVAELQRRVDKLLDGPPQSGMGFCQ